MKISVVIRSFAHTAEYLKAGVKKILKHITNKISLFFSLYFSVKATKNSKGINIDTIQKTTLTFVGSAKIKLTLDSR